jgi:hypothetical protein
MEGRLPVPPQLEVTLPLISKYWAAAQRGVVAWRRLPAGQPAIPTRCRGLFDPTAVWQGFINRVDGTLKAHKRDGTVISGHCQEQPKWRSE